MSGRELRVAVERSAVDAVVRVQGDVDLESSPVLRQHLLALLENAPPRVVVDLSAVDHVDSSGIGTLVEFKRKFHRGRGPVVLAGMKPRVRSLLEITRLDKFFEVLEAGEGGAA